MSQRSVSKEEALGKGQSADLGKEHGFPKPAGLGPHLDPCGKSPRAGRAGTQGRCCGGEASTEGKVVLHLGPKERLPTLPSPRSLGLCPCRALFWERCPPLPLPRSRHCPCHSRRDGTSVISSHGNLDLPSVGFLPTVMQSPCDCLFRGKCLPHRPKSPVRTGKGCVCTCARTCVCPSNAPPKMGTC